MEEKPTHDNTPVPAMRLLAIPSDPKAMFARVDELGDVGEEPFEIDVWRQARIHDIDL